MTDKSPRIANLPPDRWTDAARDVFGYWEGAEARAKGSRSNVMMTLANHPPLAMAVMDFGKYFLVNSTLPLRSREIIILRTAWRMECEYEWAHHRLSAKRTGLSEAQIESLCEPDISGDWDESDVVLLTVVDALQTKGSIDDALWARVAAIHPQEKLMDLLYTVGFITMNAWAIGTMRVALEPDFAAFSKSADRLVEENH
jgi:4-carboxymuconolactone decarboxylase